MSHVVTALLILLPMSLLGWFVFEWRNWRTARVAFAVAGFVMMGSGGYAMGSIGSTFELHARYSTHNKELLEAATQRLEAGGHDRVLSVFRELNTAFTPRYENDGGYFELLNAAVADLGE